MSDTMILVVFAALVLAILAAPLRNPVRWRKQAERIAKLDGIELTDSISARVQKRLRRQYMVNICLFPFIILAARTIADLGTNAHPRATSYALTVLAAPVAVIVVSLLLAIPSWNARGDRRVAHLRRPTVWEAFTKRERFALAGGVVVAVVGTIWGLWHVGAGPWWYAVPPVVMLSVGAWRQAAQALMTRPSQAGDNLELRWDDVLRFRDVRALTLAAAWVPAAVVLLVNTVFYEPAGDIAFVVIAAAAAALSIVFRQGRQLWRTLWEEGRPA